MYKMSLNINNRKLRVMLCCVTSVRRSSNRLNMISKTLIPYININKEIAAKYPTIKDTQYLNFKRTDPIFDLSSKTVMEYKRMGRHLNKFIKERAILRVNKSQLKRICEEIPKLLDKKVGANTGLYFIAGHLWESFHNAEILMTLKTPEDEQSAALLEKLLSDYLRLADEIHHDILPDPSLLKHNIAICKYMGSDVNKFINNKPILQKKKHVLIEICKEIPRMLDKEIVENLELYNAAGNLLELFHSEYFLCTLSTFDDNLSAALLEKLLSDYMDIARNYILIEDNGINEIHNPYTLL